MFTGIIETTGVVKDIIDQGSNRIFVVESVLGPELRIDQSLAHNGVCLTVTEINSKIHKVTAVQETLLKSNLGQLKLGDLVNLERSMSSGYRFDGHIVQGHVDQTAVCSRYEALDGSWLYDFEYDYEATGNFTVEKGSVCINGVSLTVFNCQKGSFRVTIIPYTYEHTNFKHIKDGTVVNLEFDIIGKYIQRMFDMGYTDLLKQKLGK